MLPAVQHCQVRQEENVFLQGLKVVFDAQGAALGQNIPSSLTGPTPAEQGRNGGQLYWPLLLPLVEIAGSE